MRLWLVSHNYAPEPTGIPYYNTGMAEWFVRHGWDVEVLTGIPHYPWWQVPAPYAARDFSHGRADETINNVIVRRVRHHVPAQPVSSAGRMRMDASFLAQWFKRSTSLRGRPDVIVGVAPPFLIGGLLLWLRQRLHVPVVYHVQDLQVDAALSLGLLPTWMRWPMLALERWQLEQVDLVTACGKGMLPRLQAKGQLRRPPRHWPNWTDCSAMAPVSGTNPERRLLDQGANDAVVGLYSGNLGRKQGLEVVIEATRLLRHEPGWRTVIAGTGVERDALARTASGLANLEFQNLRPEDRLPAFLSAADIHIIPQRREAANLLLPSKLLNILAVGRPVVATAEAGTELHDLIVAAGCGLVVPPQDPEALARALARLAQDTQLRHAMGESGRRWARAHLDIDAVLGPIAHDLTELADSYRHRDWR